MPCNLRQTAFATKKAEIGEFKPAMLKRELHFFEYSMQWLRHHPGHPFFGIPGCCTPTRLSSQYMLFLCETGVLDRLQSSRALSSHSFFLVFSYYFKVFFPPCFLFFSFSSLVIRCVFFSFLICCFQHFLWCFFLSILAACFSVYVFFHIHYSWIKSVFFLIFIFIIPFEYVSFHLTIIWQYYYFIL